MKVHLVHYPVVTWPRIQLAPNLVVKLIFVVCKISPSFASIHWVLPIEQPCPLHGLKAAGNNPTDRSDRFWHVWPTNSQCYWLKLCGHYFYILYCNHVKFCARWTCRHRSMFCQSTVLTDLTTDRLQIRFRVQCNSLCSAFMHFTALLCTCWLCQYPTRAWGGSLCHNWWEIHQGDALQPLGTRSAMVRHQNPVNDWVHMKIEIQFHWTEKSRTLRPYTTQRLPLCSSLALLTSKIPHRTHKIGRTSLRRRYEHELPLE